MSYESTNNNIRPQQMMMINPLTSSNYYNEPSTRAQMTNQYQPYSSAPSHQTFSPYGPSGYYSSYPGSYEYQQRPSGRTYYGENHLENSMTISNDYQNYNTTVPMARIPQGSIGYNNSYMMPPAHPSLKQQQDRMYGHSNVSQYSTGNPAITNTRIPAPNVNTYQNDTNSTSGKVLSHPQQTTWPSSTSTNTIDSDTPSTIPKSSSCTSVSSYVPEDIESSNSSFSDSLSISNEKPPAKRKTSHTTSLEVLNKLREMGDEQERTIFIDRLQKLWDEHHIVCRKLPCLSRQTIDLYRLYSLIREQNGFEQFSKVAKNRHWRDIASTLNIPNSSTTAFNLKQKYIHLKLFHYECKYDRGGIDPEPILIEMKRQKETPIQESIQPQQVPISTNHLSIPKTISFPTNSVESTTIPIIKRKKLTSKDILPIDPRKLLMSLRGGLLAETSWALDAINIILTDDQTHASFHLKQMPGLLQAIVNIYIKCLTQLFDEFKIANVQILDSSKNQHKQDAVIYRIESNCLDKYNKQQDITYEHVYDNQGNIKDNPENVLDLQDMDEFSYIQTHFDPLHMDDTSDEHDQEPIVSSQKEKIFDNNKEFLQHYQRKVQSDETDSTDLNSYPNQHNDTSVLFTRYSFGYDQICSRCICISSIIRNLSFISNNDLELIKDPTVIHLFARLLSLRHHSPHSFSDKKSSSWSECLINIRENTLVTLANISSVLIFDQFNSDLITPLIDGLLHWSTYHSNEEQTITQHLSIEILTKLSIHDMNIDFILATPPFSRIISLFNILIDWLNVDEMNNNNNNTSNSIRSQREFAIVLLNALIQCDSNIIHRITHLPYVISLLINFFEDYEMKTNELILRDGLDYVLSLINTDQAEEILFTTNDMLKRAGNCLFSILNCTDQIPIMKKYEDRILSLSISNVINPNIGRILTDILHICS